MGLGVGNAGSHPEGLAGSGLGVDQPLRPCPLGRAAEPLVSGIRGSQPSSERIRSVETVPRLSTKVGALEVKAGVRPSRRAASSVAAPAASSSGRGRVRGDGPPAISAIRVK